MTHINWHCAAAPPPIDDQEPSNARPSGDIVNLTPKNAPWPDVPDQRRRIMAAIRGRDTKPELLVRRLVYQLGYRYRLGRRIAGFTPDLVFSRRRRAIYVHGCFWHGHQGCPDGRIPKTRADYWGSKLRKNRERDVRAVCTLSSMGWQILVLWECEVRSVGDLTSRLVTFLGPQRWQQAPRPSRRK